MAYAAISVVPTTGPHAIANWRAFSYLGNVVTAESGGVTSTIVHDSFPVTVSVFPAWSVATERNWYVWPSWPVNDPEVVAAVATSQSVQPAPLSFTLTWEVETAVVPSVGPQSTVKEREASYLGTVSVREVGAIVSTVVLASF